MIQEYIQSNCIEIIFGFVSLFLTGMYGNVSRHLKKERKKNDAIAEGVKSLLRENIVHNYNKYQDRGYCPIYAKESIKRAYEAYHDMGGNDVATKLYNTLLEMPEEPD